MKSKLIYATSLFFLLPFMGCKKFVEVDTPQTELIRPTVFAGDKTANAAQLTIFSQMAVQGLSASYLSFYPGILADELTDFSGVDYNHDFYIDGIVANNQAVKEIWELMYKLIYESNAVIEGAEGSTTLSENVKKQVKGEALFTRAFTYFYLINYFGNVPLIKNTDYKANANLPRNKAGEVYDFIEADLVEAKGLLHDEYVGADGVTAVADRLRPNKATAAAMLAKVYLYRKDYEKAIEQSSEVIDNVNYVMDTNLDNVFLINSQEAIWQLSTGNAFNTFEGLSYILFSYPYFAALNPSMPGSFADDDLRKTRWIGMYTDGVDSFYYPFKYKVQYSTDVSEYVMVFRLAEQYLIRSEARAYLNDVTGAVKDLNMIRNRAGLADTTLTSTETLVDAVIDERKKELFTEWGHRWFDLKRTNKLNDVMQVITPLKGGTWEEYKSFLPIPQSEMIKNSRLVQNDGF